MRRGDKLKNIQKVNRLLEARSINEFGQVDGEYLGSGKPAYVKKPKKGVEGLIKISTFIKSLPDDTLETFNRYHGLGLEFDEILREMAINGETNIESTAQFDEVMELIFNNEAFFFKKLEKRFKGITK